jgi:hypothetical protein
MNKKSIVALIIFSVVLIILLLTYVSKRSSNSCGIYLDNRLPFEGKSAVRDQYGLPIIQVGSNEYWRNSVNSTNKSVFVDSILNFYINNDSLYVIFKDKSDKKNKICKSIFILNKCENIYFYEVVE